MKTKIKNFRNGDTQNYTPCVSIVKIKCLAMIVESIPLTQCQGHEDTH